MKTGSSEYVKLHKLVRLYFGRPKKCKCCGLKQQAKYTKKGYTWLVIWSNTDHKYKELKSNWRGLCGSCHPLYDAYLRAWYSPSGKPRSEYEKKWRILHQRPSPSVNLQRKWLRSIRRSRSAKQI